MDKQIGIQGLHNITRTNIYKGKTVNGANSKAIQMLELSDTNFKGAMTIMFSNIKEKKLVLSKNIGNLSRDIETMKSTEWKFKNWKKHLKIFKTSLDGFNRRMEIWCGKELVNLKIHAKELSHLKKREKQKI